MIKAPKSSGCYHIIQSEKSIESVPPSSAAIEVFYCHKQNYCQIFCDIKGPIVSFIEDKSTSRIDKWSCFEDILMEYFFIGSVLVG